jgi:hypothetical protein
MPESQPDPLELLRAHLRDAQAAAQRLVREATETPASGWEPLDAAQAVQAAEEAHSLGELLRSLRELLPEDVLAELLRLVRQLLAVLRALLDVLISRLNHPKSVAGGEIQDIPIL